MVPYDLFFYVWLVYIALPSGAAIGWSTGWITKRLLREPRRTVLVAARDSLTGFMGFVLGTVVAVMSTSFLYEEWENDKLVVRRTDGFADYAYLFAILAAVTLVVVAHLSIRLVRGSFCKTNGDEGASAST